MTNLEVVRQCTRPHSWPAPGSHDWGTHPRTWEDVISEELKARFPTIDVIASVSLVGHPRCIADITHASKQYRDKRVMANRQHTSELKQVMFSRTLYAIGYGDEEEDSS